MDTRREFLRTAALGCVAAGCLGGCGKGGAAVDTDTGEGDDTDTDFVDTDTNGAGDTGLPDGTIAVTFADYPSLANVGGSAKLKNSATGKIIVAQVAEGEFVCLSAICTHEGCDVKYVASQDDFYCPCHGSKFSDDGKVIQGPARSPLASYPATYDEPNQRVLIDTTA